MLTLVHMYMYTHHMHTHHMHTHHTHAHIHTHTHTHTLQDGSQLSITGLCLAPRLLHRDESLGVSAS